MTIARGVLAVGQARSEVGIAPISDEQFIATAYERPRAKEPRYLNSTLTIS